MNDFFFKVQRMISFSNKVKFPGEVDSKKDLNLIEISIDRKKVFLDSLKLNEGLCNNGGHLKIENSCSSVKLRIADFCL